MNVFDLSASLTLNTSQYDAGLARAEGKAGGFSGFLGSKVKMGALAAGAALGAFAKSAVDTGMTFDKSMSQVAATMGKSVSEMEGEVVTADLATGQFTGTLREFAQEMGSKTVFSANESAEALNYMALAGYDAKTAMEMLPNVLNLAAAGNMELATASDMVTDAQSALGLSLEETNQMVDKMAKASSKSNTSVEQLGSAFLTIGGTAKTLKGGTTELATALGVLADNGIKGSEGGTKLRNMVLSLSAPTSKAADALAELGVETLDAEGNMRSLPDIMGDLNGALDGLGGGDKAKILNTIFNKQDLKAVNAMLGTTPQRYEELASAIDDSAGAAQKMADTQLDNLSGDVTLFKSAWEGLQIALSDKVSPALRGVVQVGSTAVSGLTEALKGGFEDIDIAGAVTDGLESLLPKMVEFSGKLREKAGDFVSAGLEMLKGVAKGFADALPTLIATVPTIISNIAGIINDNAPKLITTGLSIIATLAVGIVKAIPALIANIPKILKAIFDVFMAFNWVNLGKLAFTKIKGGIPKAWGAIKTATSNLVKKIPSVIRSGLSNLPALAKTMFSKIANGIGAAARGIWNKALSLAKGIVQKVKSGIANIASVGKEIVSGLWKGMSNATDWLKGLIKGWVGNVKDFLKSLFGIESPSKWARDVIGYNIVAGMAKGISDNADMVDEAFDDLMPDMTTTAVTDGTFVPAMQAIMTEGMASVMGDWAPDLADAMAEALQNVTVKMGRRELGRLTREAVHGTI